MEFLHWDQWSKTLHFISASTRDKSQQHYAFNVYIQTTRNLVFNTLDVKQHMVALQHSIRSDSVTHSAKIFPETLCVRLSRATLLYAMWTTTAWQCGAFIALEALLKVSLGAVAGVAPHFLPQLSILLHDRHFCYGARWFTTIGMFFPDLKRDSVSKVSSSNERCWGELIQTW